MSNIIMYQVDAFAKRVFEGNPAAVCPLEQWLPDTTLQAIAAENNLAETAFVVLRGEEYSIRWFTPRMEAPLCGHATLAASFVLFSILGVDKDEIRFTSQAGPLSVRRDGKWLAMDFPAYALEEIEVPGRMLDAFDISPDKVFRTREDPNYHLIYRSSDEVRKLMPNLSFLEQWPNYGFAVSGPDRQYDCVSRYFAPGAGIPEDPVTGSIHSALVPYWAEQRGKNRIHGYQASARGGELLCDYRPEARRVIIRGEAVLYLQGTISIP